MILPSLAREQLLVALDDMMSSKSGDCRGAEDDHPLSGGRLGFAEGEALMVNALQLALDREPPRASLPGLFAEPPLAQHSEI
jgi:hypothetical protein